MKARLLSAFAVLALAAACDENPPDSAYETPTPFESPTPGVTPVAVTVPGDGTLTGASGRISAPGERDLFTFPLAAGDTVRVDVDAQGMTPSSANLDAQLTLYAPTGEVLAISDDGTNLWEPGGSSTPGALRDPYVVAAATAAGTYTLVLEDANGGGDDNEEFDYRVSFSLVLPATLEGGNACLDAEPLPLLTQTNAVVSVSGTVLPTSTDSCCNTQVLPCVGARVSAPDVTYVATLSSGQRVQITRTGAGFDGAIYVSTVCDALNTLIMNSCVAGGDGADDADGFVFTPEATGNYFVFVDGVSGSGGAFTLDLRLVP